MYEIHLNNEVLSHKKVKKIFRSIQDKKVLKAKGGFLFKSSINETEFHLGILPVLIEGERTHHYDIKLDYIDPYVFSGFFNADGTFGAVFTPPDKKELITEKYKEELKICYIATAQVLISNGVSAEMELDWITKTILEEAALFPEIPAVLGDLKTGE